MKKKFWVKIFLGIVAVFLAMNIVAAFHAFRFTHFARSSSSKIKGAAKLSHTEKVKAILFGISYPRPSNSEAPSGSFETIMLESNKSIECWSIKADSSKGTVVVFHGYGGKKSAMLDKSAEFLAQGYNVLLADFMGSGGSEGNQTTIGFHEAKQVKTCYDYLASRGERDIYLFGTSMGAVAILKAMNDYDLQPKGIIVECPFGTMYETTCARFRMLGAPSFPMAGLLVFWGGVENSFWAFSHRPVDYAKSIKCPTLLLYGEQDEKVSRNEIDQIYTNLNGKKWLKTYPLAGHENYLNKYSVQWRLDVREFMEHVDGPSLSVH